MTNRYAISIQIDIYVAYAIVVCYTRYYVLSDVLIQFIVSTSRGCLTEYTRPKDLMSTRGKALVSIEHLTR